MNNEIIARGQRCFAAVKMAHDLIGSKGGVDRAKELLANVKEDGEFLQENAKETQEKLVREAKELRAEIERLEREEQRFRLEVSSLTSKKSTTERNLQSDERSLSQKQSQLAEEERRLSDAEWDLKKAKEKEKEIAVASVVGGTLVGLVTFGVGGLLAGAAIGGSTAAIVNNIEGRCRDARRVVSRWKSDVGSTESSIRSYRNSISQYERDIQSYRQRLRDNEQAAVAAHEKTSVLMKSKTFCDTSHDFWTEFTALSKTATEKTDRLEKLVGRVLERGNFRVLRANGTVVLANTFVEAWEEVTKRGMIMSSE